MSAESAHEEYMIDQQQDTIETVPRIEADAAKSLGKLMLIENDQLAFDLAA